MNKLLILVAALGLLASCNSNPDCTCVAAAACNEPGAQDADTCGVGLVCCPVNADGGFEY